MGLKLPNVSTENQQLPSPSLDVVGSDSGAVARAITGAGQTVSEIGQMVMREQQRRDVSSAENAFTQARQAQIDLAAGPDGYLSKRGDAALTDTFHSDYMTKFDDNVKTISDGLQNDKQRQLFAQRSAISRTQVSEGLLTHTMQQDDVANKEHYAGLLDTESKFAYMNALNPQEINMSVLRVQQAVKQQAERNSWPPEFAQAETDKQVGAIHETAINAMIQQGYDLAAKQYFDQNKASMDANSAAQVDAKLKMATTDGKAFRAVNDIWTKLGPTNPNDPVKIFDMEAAARKQLGGDPNALKAAVGEIRSRYSAFNSQQQELTSSNVSTVLGNFDNGMTLMNIKKTPEFQALDGKNQNIIIDHLTTTEKDVTLTPENARLIDSVKGLAITDPVAFSNYDVGSLVGKMPNADVQNIINLKLSTDKNAEKSTRINTLLSDASVRSVLDTAGVTNPGKKAQGSDYNAFVSKYAAAIDQFQFEHKASPTLKDARNIAAQLTASIPLHRDYWFDSSAKAYALKPTDTIAIHDTDRQAISASLSKYGMPINEENIQRAYRLSKGVQ
jgi:hypothetical protein